MDLLSDIIMTKLAYNMRMGGLEGASLTDQIEISALMESKKKRNCREISCRNYKS